MEMSFRWYGHHDPVKLEDIRVIPGMQGIVTAVYDVPVGEAWPLENIEKLKASVEEQGMHISVIESIPVHEDIKLGKANRDQLIENYKESIRNVGKAGIPVVCYNFMPVFDWTRTDLEYLLPDGSTCLAFFKDEAEAVDPINGDFSLPGWDASYTKEEMAQVFADYAEVDEKQLWENLEYFLKEIIPVAEEAGVKMAIHPDDPPYSIFGLPRIITGLDAVKRFLDIVDSPSNGITMDHGCYFSDGKNDVDAIMEYALKRDRINFVHARNVQAGDWGFMETGHLSANGDVDFYSMMDLLVKYGWEGPIRPDHGRRIWGDQTETPGYGLYDRALGVAYINGLYEALCHKYDRKPDFGQSVYPHDEELLKNRK